MKYVLNSYYILRHDKRRTFILGGQNGRIDNKHKVDLNWKSIIHPSYAMMLSFFSEPIELHDALDKISSFFDFEPSQIEAFLHHLIDAEECWHTDLGGFENGFPINLIIEECNQDNKLETYHPEDFKFDIVDGVSKRMLIAPLSIVWMPNNNCYTACEYCYADRSLHKSLFSIENMRTFVQDAVVSGVAEIMVTGGDIFMNPNWREILSILHEYGYKIDLISTKKPLSNIELEDFSKYGIQLQVSLDTTDKNIACKLLNVNANYIPMVLNMLNVADNLGIKFQVATVLTKLNCNIGNLERIYTILRSYKQIYQWEIRIAFRSLYSKIDFDKIKASRNQIIEVENWINEKKNESILNIVWSPDDDEKLKKSSGGSMNFEGPRCSANISNMIVLPDGNVSICEQLYWHPHFIIGNVFKDSISSIWTSEKALSLWKQSQDSISATSRCKNCSDFFVCFENGNRCFANILKAYGIDNYDYPDPRCIMAPEFVNNITH